MEYVETAAEDHVILQPPPADNVEVSAVGECIDMEAFRKEFGRLTAEAKDDVFFDETDFNEYSISRQPERFDMVEEAAVQYENIFPSINQQQDMASLSAHQADSSSTTSVSPLWSPDSDQQQQATHVSEEFVNYHKTRLKADYPRYYTSSKSISLSLDAPSPKDPVLQYKRTLLQMTYPTVSNDGNIPQLAIENNVDIVISSSALNAIMAIQANPMGFEVEIPVEVRAYAIPTTSSQNQQVGGETQQKRKVVFIDKPLIKKKITNLDRQRIFHKAAFESLCVHHRVIPSSQKDPISQVNSAHAQALQQQVESSALPDSGKDSQESAPISTATGMELDAESLDGEKTSHVRLGRETTRGAASVDFPDSGPPTTVAMESSKSSHPNSHKKDGGASHDKAFDPPIPESHPPKIDGVQETHSASPPGASERSPPPALLDNIWYNLWSFGELNVLIRCKVHGHMFERSPVTGQPQLRYVGFQTRLQQRTDVDEFTVEERARWWMYTFIRPDAHLIVGTVNPVKNEISRIDYLKMADIIHNGVCKLLYHVLSATNRLLPGKYIITGSKNNLPGRTLTILQALPDLGLLGSAGAAGLSDVYDLYAEHSGNWSAPDDNGPNIQQQNRKQQQAKGKKKKMKKQKQKPKHIVDWDNVPSGGDARSQSDAPLLHSEQGGTQVREPVDEFERLLQSYTSES
ncbi:hypothetical protein HK102_001292 [Quaeritorhiza haematococci]|nr:hypothetical protein HK102_001292 [Quaeritorhiza haematococci]